MQVILNMRQRISVLAERCSSSVLADRHEVLGALLDESHLVLEHRQSLLEPGDLGLTPCLPVGISLRLGNALLLNLAEVLVHGRQFGLNIALVRAELGIGLVKARGLLGLVLDILVLGGLLDLVLLGFLLKCVLSSLLGSVHLCQALREISLAHFEEADDSSAGTIARAVRLVSLGIVFVQDLQGQLDATQALLHLGAVGLPCGLLLGADLVHLGLLLDECCKLLLQGGDLGLELLGMRCLLLNLGSELLNLCGLVGLLLVGLGQLLVAIRLLG